MRMIATDRQTGMQHVTNRYPCSQTGTKHTQLVSHQSTLPSLSILIMEGEPAPSTSDSVLQQQPDPPLSEAVPGGSSSPTKPGKKKYRQIVMPSPEQMMQDEFMNNCATRTVVSAAMGSVMGVFFGILMGTMDGAVSS